MSQVSEQIKAQRKQHRQDHFTDADRTAMRDNKGDQKGRRDARRANWNAQGNQSASDFNFDQHGKGHIGGQEIRHLQNQGHSKDDIMAAATANGGELGARAQKRFGRWTADKKPDTSHIDNLPDGLDPEIVLKAHEGQGWGAEDQARYDKVKAGQAKEKAQNYNQQKDIGNTTQTVTQDNDQTSTVNGNNNYVYQNQDNSVRNYGGSTRVFNYQSGSNGGDSSLDTPASAATMGGFYAPDDSHGAIAGRISRNQTLNADAQKKYANTSHIAQGAISRASNNAYIDPASLDKRIADRASYSRAKATTMGANLFGDMGAFQMPDYKRPDPQKAVETPDFEKMYETYSDF